MLRTCHWGDPVITQIMYVVYMISYQMANEHGKYILRVFYKLALWLSAHVEADSIGFASFGTRFQYTLLLFRMGEERIGEEERENC